MPQKFLSTKSRFKDIKGDVTKPTFRDPRVAIDIPIIFYWQDDEYMTAAFQWKKRNYGLSFGLVDNEVRNQMNKKKLLLQVGETLDVMLHHGREILDSSGNLNYTKVNDIESRKFFLDKDWAKKVAFIYSMMRTKDITREKAQKLGLL